MHFHVRMKVALPQKRFATDGTSELPFTFVLHHMQPQKIIVEKLFAAQSARNVLFLQMCPSYMILHKRIPSEHLSTVLTLVPYIVNSYQMLLLVVLRAKEFGTLRALVVFYIVGLSTVPCETPLILILYTANITLSTTGMRVRNVDFEIGDVFESATAVIANFIIIAMFSVHMPLQDPEVSKSTVRAVWTRYVVFYDPERL